MTDKLKPAELKTQLATAKAELKGTLERVQQLRDFITVTEKLVRRKGSSALSTPAIPGGNMVVIPHRRRTKTSVLTNSIVEILAQAGKPMHVKDIVAKLADRGESITSQNPEASVAVALSRRVEQFKKVSGNTFDLVNREAKATG